MTGYPETATERLLREERERAKLLGGLAASGSFKKGSVAQALEDAVRPFREEQRLIDTIDPHRYLRDALSSTLGGPLQREIDELNRTQTLLASGGAGAYQPAPAPTARPPASNAITSAADLGPLIRKARKALKLNQGEFAAHAGVGRRFISELESGKASLEFDKVIACAAAAGIDIFARPRRAG